MGNNRDKKYIFLRFEFIFSHVFAEQIRWKIILYEISCKGTQSGKTPKKKANARTQPNSKQSSQMQKGKSENFQVHTNKNNL